MKTLLLAAAIGLAASTASAMPLGGNLAKPSTMVQNARIVCEESGYCYRPPGRRPVARWIYGDRAFSGPYTGPGNYGWPNWHSRWFW